jgi:hypothetical protein
MQSTAVAVASLLMLATPAPGGSPAVPHRDAVQSVAPRQWGALMPGRYGVGFRLAPQYDQSRRIAPQVDFEGTRRQGSTAMPLPVAIWYPAVRTRSSTPLQYGTFAALGSKRADLTPVTPADRAAAVASMRSFAGFAFGRQISEASMSAVDTTTTGAVRDAPPAAGRFPVILAAMDGSVASATVLFEYLASQGFVVMAVPSQASYATVQVSRPAVVVNARVRDLEFLLDRARTYSFVDTARVAVLGVNFDGMAALAFQMKNMAARAVMSLDGWEGKQSIIETVRSELSYDPRRMRVPYFVVLQHEPQPPPGLRLDRTIFDAMRYSERQWLVLNAMTHAYLIGNPVVYPDVPPEKRAAYEYLVRATHRFLATALVDSSRDLAEADPRLDSSTLVKETVHVAASPAVPDDAELERLIMIDRAVDKVATIVPRERVTDSSFALFPEQTMALFAFRFTRGNDRAYALRLRELNAEAFPRSWTAADALGDTYRDAGDTAKALASYTRALSAAPVGSERAAIEQKIGKLRTP